MDMEVAWFMGKLINHGNYKWKTGGRLFYFHFDFFKNLKVCLGT